MAGGPAALSFGGSLGVAGGGIAGFVAAGGLFGAALSSDRSTGERLGLGAGGLFLGTLSAVLASTGIGELRALGAGRPMIGGLVAGVVGALALGGVTGWLATRASTAG